MNLITRFVRRSKELNVPSLLGSIVFSSKLELRSDLTGDADSFVISLVKEGERPSGITVLFLAIERDAQLLVDAKRVGGGESGAVLRIIVFSDVEDTYSKNPEIAGITNLFISGGIRANRCCSGSTKASWQTNCSVLC